MKTFTETTPVKIVFYDAVKEFCWKYKLGFKRLIFKY